MQTQKQAEQIYLRLKQITQVSSDVELAKEIGLTPQAFSIFKNQNRWPIKRLTAYCKRKGVSEKWLFLGEGLPKQVDVVHQEAEELRVIMEHLKENPPLRNLLLAFINGSVYGRRISHRVNTSGINPVAMKLQIDAITSEGKPTFLPRKKPKTA